MLMKVTIMPIMLYICIVKLNMCIMKDYSISDSVLMNRNFRVKIGRSLYGYSGACNLLCSKRVNAILTKALRSRLDVYRFKSQSLNLMVCFYAK